MSELQQRLTALSERGRRRGADDVLDAAIRAASGATRSTDVTEEAVMDATRLDVLGVAGDELPPPISMEEARDRRFRPGRSLFAVAGLAAMLGVGMLAAIALGGDGGGNSPEDAVRRLAAAVEQEDALAAADVLAPDEVRTLQESLDAASRRAAELELVETAMAPFAGLDLSIDGFELSAEPMADGFSKVVVHDGTLRSETHTEEFSALLQRAIGYSGDASAELAAADLRSDVAGDPFVVTVQRDGNWYVSPAYTLLEYVRVLNDLPAADLGSAQTARLGADTPEAAATEAILALGDKNLERVFALLPPDELPLYDYRAALTQLAAESDWGFTVERLSTTSQVDGNEAIVSVEASGSSTTEFAEEGDTWTLAGGCLRADSRDGEDSYVNYVLCLGGDGPTPLGPGSGDLAGPTRFRAVRQDGRWFVSPVATVLDHLDAWIAGFDQHDLYELLGLEHLLPSEATLVLGEPLPVVEPEGRVHVYSFEGRAGQEVIGHAEATGPQPDGYLDYYGQVYGPDAEELEDGYGVFRGEAATLPVDGTYTLIVRVYEAGDFTLTLWDAEKAPPEAFESPYDVIDEECVTEVDGRLTCESSDFDSVAPATTAAAADVVP